MILRRDGLMTSVNILRLNLPNYCYNMKQEQKYEEAFAQLQDIVRKMENDEYSIDEIAVQLKEAQRLIKFCKDKLTKTEEEISKVQAERE